MDNAMAQDKFTIGTTAEYANHVMAANQYVTGGSAEDREYREGSGIERRPGSKPAAPKKVKLGKQFFAQRGELFFDRMFTEEEVEDATSFDLEGPEATRLKDMVEATVALALEVQSEGYRGQRKTFAKFTPTHSLVPELPATFLGKVKPGNLRTIVALEAELSAREITDGWRPRSEGGSATLREMRDLLRSNGAVDGDGYLVGGIKGQLTEEQSDADVAEMVEATEDALDSFDDGQGAAGEGQQPAPRRSGRVRHDTERAAATRADR